MFTSLWFITIIDYIPYHKCHCKWYLHSKEKKGGGVLLLRFKGTCMHFWGVKNEYCTSFSTYTHINQFS